jgi:hypothetical protein
MAITINANGSSPSWRSSYGDQDFISESAARAWESNYLAQQKKDQSPVVTSMPVTDPNNMTGSQLRDMTPEQSRQVRETDWNTGLARGKNLFSEGSLGRMDPASSGVYQAQRQLAQGQLNRAMQSQDRALKAQQARAQMPASASFAQRAALTKQSQQAQQDLSRQQTLDVYGQEKERTQYNQGQQSKELFGQLATALSEQGFGVTERGGLMQSDIAKAMAQAAQSSGGGGKK